MWLEAAALSGLSRAMQLTAALGAVCRLDKMALAFGQHWVSLTEVRVGQREAAAAAAAADACGPGNGMHACASMGGLTVQEGGYGNGGQTLILGLPKALDTKQIVEVPSQLTCAVGTTCAAWIDMSLCLQCMADEVRGPAARHAAWLVVVQTPRTAGTQVGTLCVRLRTLEQPH